MDFSSIDAMLDRQDVRGAVAALQQAMGYPATADAATWAAAARRLAQAAGTDAPALRRAALRLADAPADLQALYDTGYQLFEAGLFDLAAAAFARAEGLAPGLAPVVSELVAALEELGRYGDARNLLQRHAALLDEGFLFVYLSAFNAILSGHPGEARALLPRLVPADGGERFMADRIRHMLAREAHIRPVTGLGPVDLRGWHHVLTGGTLLHLSSAGFSSAMRGRYAFVQDTLGRLRDATDQMHALLLALGAPERILLLPERGSEALGRALSAVTGIPAAPFQPEARGLVVAYDLDALPMQTQVALRQHRPEQPLWAHAVCWTQPPICAPDVATYLYQVSHAPWEGSLGLSEDDAPAVSGSAEQIAQAILAAAPDEEDALPEQRAPMWAALAAAEEDAAPAWRRSEGPRERLWFMGPVFSNHF